MTRIINGIEFPCVEPVLLQTTLNLCRKQNACEDAEEIAHKLGVGSDEPVNLLDVLRVSSIKDCLWALRAVLPGQEADRDRAARLMAAEFAAEALPLLEAERPDDNCPRLAIEAARDFALDKITDAGLVAVQSAACDSSLAATWAGLGATARAAWAAWAATDASAWAATDAAAWAARDAAGAATEDAARTAQRAIITSYLKA